MSSATPTIRLFQPAHSPQVEQTALEVLRSGQIASGGRVASFEAAIAALIGRPEVVTTDDMTSALMLALHLANVGPGDEVLTMAYSCLSSNSAVVRIGATPVWVDIDPATASMSIDDLKRAITPRTKAVMVYHVAGYPARMTEIAALCRECGIVVIEDCNNALGARLGNAPVGQIGDFAVYSFYPNRQVNAVEGGALACPSAAVSARARRLRRFGIDAAKFRDRLGEISPVSNVPEIGWSASLSNLNAAIGLAQLPALESQLRRTRDNAARLRDACTGVAGFVPVTAIPGAEPCYWAFLALADRRDERLSRLKKGGVHASKLHHRNDDYTGFAAHRRPLPGTDEFMSRVLALPCGWWLADEEMDRLIEQLRRA